MIRQSLAVRCIWTNLRINLKLKRLKYEDGYNHSNPHTYAMTAIRNPEYETLINILKTINFDD